jgi:hypothetical protein
MFLYDDYLFPYLLLDPTHHVIHVLTLTSHWQCVVHPDDFALWYPALCQIHRAVFDAMLVVDLDTGAPALWLSTFFGSVVVRLVEEAVVTALDVPKLVASSGCVEYFTTLMDTYSCFSMDDLHSAMQGMTPSDVPSGDVPQGAPSGEAPQQGPAGEAPQQGPSEDAPQGAPSGEAPQGAPSGEAPQEDPSGEAPQEDPEDGDMTPPSPHPEDIRSWDEDHWDYGPPENHEVPTPWSEIVTSVTSFVAKVRAWVLTGVHRLRQVMSPVSPSESCIPDMPMPSLRERVASWLGGLGRWFQGFFGRPPKPATGAATSSSSKGKGAATSSSKGKGAATSSSKGKGAATSSSTSGGAWTSTKPGEASCSTESVEGSRSTKPVEGSRSTVSVEVSSSRKAPDTAFGRLLKRLLTGGQKEAKAPTPPPTQRPSLEDLGLDRQTLSEEDQENIDALFLYWDELDEEEKAEHLREVKQMYAFWGSHYAARHDPWGAGKWARKSSSTPPVSEPVTETEVVSDAEAVAAAQAASTSSFDPEELHAADTSQAVVSPGSPPGSPSGSGMAPKQSRAARRAAAREEKKRAKKAGRPGRHAGSHVSDADEAIARRLMQEELGISPPPPPSRRGRRGGKKNP